YTTLFRSPISIEQANALERQQIQTLQNFAKAEMTHEAEVVAVQAESILALREAAPDARKAVYRQAGDSYILLEYGDNVLDLALRLRVHRLMQLIRKADLEGILELSPGVRSLQIKYDGLQCSQQQLIHFLLGLEEQMGDLRDIKIPSRIIHLPMAFEDSATLGAVERYQESVCAKAPWLPNNVDFIQRING